MAVSQPAANSAAVAAAPTVDMVPKPMTSVLQDLTSFKGLPSLGTLTALVQAVSVAHSNVWYNTPEQSPLCLDPEIRHDMQASLRTTLKQSSASLDCCRQKTWTQSLGVELPLLSCTYFTMPTGF